MMTIEWCRLWHDMPTDPKWRVIAKRSKRPISEVVSVFVFLMTDGSANARQRGQTHANGDQRTGAFAEQTAAAFGMESEHARAILDAMRGSVLSDDGLLIGWEKRQPKREDSSSTERWHRWKEKQGQRTPTQTNARQRKQTLYLDTDKDTEKKEPPIAPQMGDLTQRLFDFDDFWESYPKRCGTNSKTKALEKFMLIVKNGTDPASIIVGAERYRLHCDAEHKTNTQFVQKATTWLNDRGWETDYGKRTNGIDAAFERIDRAIATTGGSEEGNTEDLIRLPGRR